MAQHTPPAAVGRALLTPDEVSALLRIPTATLAVWRSTGRVQLRFVKIGRAVRYLPDDIEAYVAQQLHTP